MLTHRLISASSDARLAVGSKLAAERVFSQEDVLHFVQLTGDSNPIHAPAADACGALTDMAEGPEAATPVAPGHGHATTAGARQQPGPQTLAAAQPAAASGQSAIVPGMLMASMFPALIGSAFPGALYLSQDLSFRRTAHVGDTVRAEVAVMRRSGSRVVFHTKCVQLPSLQVLVDGKALALIKE